MADRSLQRMEVFLKNWHVSFIGPYRLTSIQQGKSFYMYILVGYFMLILKKCMKCVLRVGSSQRSPRIMRAWERMRNFIISKRICGLKTFFYPTGTFNQVM